LKKSSSNTGWDGLDLSNEELQIPEAPMRSGILIRHDSNVKRGMGRPKLT